MKPLTLGNVTLQLPLTVETTDAIWDAHRVQVADVDPRAVMSHAEAVAYATLFAASPDLLLAAEALLDIHSLGTLAGKDKAIADATDVLIAAIARARGKES